ncbi:DUF2975 domain-containing protein [Ideonella sp. 4Y11]|uniref:DUF2975 domain-containing protein n=1 Tax=Ideonella aquatica TaxID=2824119 RepID=A0A940YEW8_9BURK|nr:DUF2975 domain-containing protein [Ideonella aquatica]MBQ0958953.1 DUF2975 domain-containing protein [Ideonella aquatica]
MEIETPSSSASPPRSPVLAHRLRRLAGAVRGLALLGSLCLLVLPFWIIGGSADSAEPLQGLYGGHVVGLAQAGLTAAVRWRLAGVTLLPVAVAVAALWQLWWLFGHYRHGDVFSERAVQRLRRFGAAMVALAVVQPLSTSLAAVAASLDNPPGQRAVVLIIGSSDYAVLMCALVFLALGRVIGEAARLAQENQEFV